LAIADSGLTLARLEYHLSQRGHHVARSTISFWQQGRRRPERPESIEALRALEEILGLPANSLSALLGPPKPRGRWIGYRPGGLEWSDVWTDGAAVHRVLSAGARRENQKLEEVSVQEAIEVDANRVLTTTRQRLLLRARSEGADRYVILHYTDPGVDAGKLAVDQLENCRIGRQRSLPEARLAAFELLFDRSLRVGESHFFSYRTLLPPPDDPSADESQPATGRVFRNAIHSYVLQAQFDEAMLPVRCYWVRYARLGGTEQIMAELPLTRQHIAHFSLESALPAAQGIRWEWE
jgi:hypothetical protein